MQVVVEKLTPERRRELTRSTLIDAAADVFAKRGFPAPSLEEIQKARGASMSIDADTMAGIVLPASQGFWQWTALDPDQARYYTEFLKVLIRGVGYEQT